MPKAGMPQQPQARARARAAMATAWLALAAAAAAPERADALATPSETQPAGWSGECLHLELPRLEASMGCMGIMWLPAGTWLQNRQVTSMEASGSSWINEWNDSRGMLCGGGGGQGPLAFFLKNLDSSWMVVWRECFVQCASPAKNHSSIPNRYIAEACTYTHSKK